MAAEKAIEPPVAKPVTAEDRTYLLAMYQEHAQHAREHEQLRASATALFVALIAGLLAYSQTQRAGEVEAGILICAVSALGALLNVKHHERFELHRGILGALRKSLEKGVTDGIAHINRDYRRWHETQRPFVSKRIRLHVLWLVVYALTFVAELNALAS